MPHMNLKSKSYKELYIINVNQCYELFCLCEYERLRHDGCDSPLYQNQYNGISYQSALIAASSL